MFGVARQVLHEARQDAHAEDLVDRRIALDAEHATNLRRGRDNGVDVARLERLQDLSDLTVIAEFDELDGGTDFARALDGVGVGRRRIAVGSYAVGQRNVFAAAVAALLQALLLLRLAQLIRLRRATTTQVVHVEFLLKVLAAFVNASLLSTQQQQQQQSHARRAAHTRVATCEKKKRAVENQRSSRQRHTAHAHEKYGIDATHDAIKEAPHTTTSKRRLETLVSLK